MKSRGQPDRDPLALQREARLRLLRMHYEAGVGHIGGNLSAIDALLQLHHFVMDDDDSFVLAKGHAAGALYVTLWTLGELDDSQLTSFHAEDTLLAGHPAPGWTPGIRVATGSLGHGLPLSAGIALGRRLRRRRGRVFCLTSDGEWQEGSNWEALIFACQQALEQLVILVDANGLQGFGRVEEVGSLSGMRQRFEAFGLAVREIDGHDSAALQEALASPEPGPRVVLMQTTKGKGVSFMEDKLEWHYLPLDEALYARACEEVSAA